jgi:hypothetical protein
MSTPSPEGETITIPRSIVQRLLDITIGSTDYCSGFLDDEEVEALRAVAVALGVDPMKATPPLQVRGASRALGQAEPRVRKHLPTLSARLQAPRSARDLRAALHARRRSGARRAVCPCCGVLLHVAWRGASADLRGTRRASKRAREGHGIRASPREHRLIKRGARRRAPLVWFARLTR